MEENAMKEQVIKNREIIEERFTKLHDEVYQQLVKAEKNEYDSDIKLPICNMMEDIPLKKHYDIINMGNDTTKKEERRINSLSVLENHILNNEQDDAKRIIKKKYYTSLSEISKKSYRKYICNEKTTTKLIKSLLQLIGCNDVESFPTILTDDILECVEKWCPHNKTLYKCCREPDKLLDYMNEDVMFNTYQFYKIVKQTILIDCNNKEEYKKRVECLCKNPKLNAVYNAVRTII